MNCTEDISEHIPHARLLVLAAVHDREVTPEESDHLDSCNRCLDLFRRCCITIRDRREHAASN